MAFFPLFINLQHKLCVVVGGGPVAARKVRTLLEFGAAVRVVSPEVTAEIAALAAAEQIELKLRTYEEDDCRDAFLIIAATSSRELNRRIQRTATAGGIFVNVVDAPELCSFLFPAIVKRQDLVVGINTAGKFPALAKRLREKIAALLSPVYGSILDILAPRREKILRLADEGQKKQLIDKLLAEAEQIKTAGQLESWQAALDKVLKESKEGLVRKLVEDISEKKEEE